MSTGTGSVRPPTGRTSRRFGTARSLSGTLLALVVALSLGVLGTFAATGPDGPSPAQGHAEVIAQGVVPLPSPRASWRIESVSAPLPDQAASQSWPLGFVLADNGAILVSDHATGHLSRLADGEASFVRNQTTQTRTSLGSTAATYDELALLPAGTEKAVTDGSKLVFQSDAFSVPQGDHDLDLVRDVLAPGESGKLADQGTPVLVLATNGSLTVKTSADAVARTLAAGKAGLFTGSLTISASGNAHATYIAAVIGPEVKLPVTPTATAAPPTGTTEATVLACPEGYDASGQSPDTLASDCTQPLQGVTVHYRTSGADLPKTTDGNGRAGFVDLLPNTIDLVEDVPSGYQLARVACTFTYPAQSDGTPAGSGNVEGSPDQGGLIGHDFREGEKLTCALYNLPASIASPTAEPTQSASPTAS
jgi:hypothetical protein